MKHLSFILLLLLPFAAFSQPDTLPAGVEQNKIYVLAKVEKDRVILRYAPSNAFGSFAKHKGISKSL